MRFKFDENLESHLAVPLSAAGHDVSTVLAERLSGRPDETIYAVCQAERRILVTLDLDFSNPLRFPVAGTPGIFVLRPSRPVLRLVARLIE
jgi:predicted nuclease of predicted toxin-antitoxin system